jgi:hypothetical protein
MTPAFLIYLDALKKKEERRLTEANYSLVNLKRRPKVIIG